MHIGGRPYSPPDLRRLVAVGSTQFYHHRESYFVGAKAFLRSQKNMERRLENLVSVERFHKGLVRGEEMSGCVGVVLRDEGLGFFFLVLFFIV